MIRSVRLHKPAQRASDVETGAGNELRQRRSEEDDCVSHVARLFNAERHVPVFQKPLYGGLPVDAITCDQLIDDASGRVHILV